MGSIVDCGHNGNHGQQHLSLFVDDFHTVRSATVCLTYAFLMMMLDVMFTENMHHTPIDSKQHTKKNQLVINQSLDLLRLCF